ncbi:UNKNOWN [Stylonychia lemnae]|uniref:Uncharacterized protein n=1 Tax=Stylonychia lemnae TaxID=5949 RepID=A0A078AZQ0_STYLE|nr:UNKNOWN [Stylonychia lemnae]|eukprot:CDW87885.1 UNKNOWN [Stylonychia lemnae]
MTGKLSQTTLKNIVLLTKNVERSSNFFSEIIGLKLLHQTANLAELKDQRDFRLIIRQSPKQLYIANLQLIYSLAYSTYGYSPILNFEIPQSEEFIEVIDKAKLHYKCQLDGDIQEDNYLKIVCLRMEEGQTISLSQVVQENEVEKEYDQLIKDEGTSVFEKERLMDPKQQELRRLFDAIKL